MAENNGEYVFSFYNEFHTLGSEANAEVLDKMNALNIDADANSDLSSWEDEFTDLARAEVEDDEVLELEERLITIFSLANAIDPTLTEELLHKAYIYRILEEGLIADQLESDCDDELKRPINNLIHDINDIEGDSSYIISTNVSFVRKTMSPLISEILSKKELDEFVNEAAIDCSINEKDSYARDVDRAEAIAKIAIGNLAKRIFRFRLSKPIMPSIKEM